jgi:hypothetical protein
MSLWDQTEFCLSHTRASPAKEPDCPRAMNSVGMRALFSLQERLTKVLPSIQFEGWGELLILILLLRVKSIYYPET